MKKILVLLVAFIFAFTLLVGCNETADNESSSYESVEEQSVESKVDAVVSEDESSEAESDETSVESEAEELNIADYFAEAFDRSDGSKIYCIDNAEQLYNFAKLVNKENIDFDGDVVLLRNDIELNPTDNIDDWENNPPENKWTPIGISVSFKGVFVGGYVEDNGLNTYRYQTERKAINGIYCTYNKEGTALFARIGDAEISNITLGKGKIIGNEEEIQDKAAGFVVYADDSIINSCKNYADVSGRNAAGIAYSVRGTNIYATNYGKISAVNGTAAGVVVHISDSAITSHNNGEINGKRAAGIVYEQGGSVIKCCLNKGDVTAEFIAGGILGAGSFEGVAAVASCVNYGDIVGGEIAGGIIGDLWEEQSAMWVMDVLNVGSVTTLRYDEDSPLGEPYGSAGGIVGRLVCCSVDGLGDFRLDGALNLGKITAPGDYGAIIGDEPTKQDTDLFANCYYLNTTVKDSVVGTPLKKSQLTDEDALEGLLDHMNWEIDEELGHPILARDHVPSA